MITDKNNLYNKAYAFSIKVVNICETLIKEQKEFVLSKQLIRSGTSIGANIAEANGAISKQDFSAKISIAYKECLETKYWISLLKDTKHLEDKIFQDLYNSTDELAKILFSILKSTRIEKKANC